MHDIRTHENRHGRSAGLTRRVFLGGALGVAATAMVGCAGRAAEPRRVAPDSQPVRAAESRRRRAGARVHDVVLRAAPGQADLGGLVVATWLYDGRLPGREVRVTAGDVLRARVVNDLPAETSVHWHGI